MGHIWLSQASRGAQITFIDAQNEQLTVEAYERVIDDRTLIVPLTHVCFAMASVCRERNYEDRSPPGRNWCCWTTIRTAAAGRWNVKAMDLDFYVSGTFEDTC